MTDLRGMTWDHPRGYAPLEACAAAWGERTGIAIRWDRRSLQDFESFPVERLARQYDLIVIDHPHVGQIAEAGCLVAFEAGEGIAAIAAGSVGPSFESYRWNGAQWALPIDAAAQVQCWRPDLIDAPARTWDDVFGLASRVAVMLPLRPPHDLMAFYTIAANLGTPCATDGPMLIDPATGRAALDRLRALVRHIDPVCFELDPIGVAEAMSAAGSAVACAPLIYGYVSYAVDGFRPHRLTFADIPAAGEAGPRGSTLGGTGLAVSAFGAAPHLAQEFARWVTGAAAQRGLYARSGGQPGHADAWSDPDVDAAAGGFYRATRETLEGAWVRPRYPGAMAFQTAASRRLRAGLLDASDGSVIADLNGMFRELQRPAERKP